MYTNTEEEKVNPIISSVQNDTPIELSVSNFLSDQLGLDKSMKQHSNRLVHCFR